MFVMQPIASEKIDGEQAFTSDNKTVEVPPRREKPIVPWSVIAYESQPRQAPMALNHAYNVNALVAMLHGKSTENGWWIDPDTGQDLSTFKWFPYVVATKLMLTVSELAEGMEGSRKGLMDDKLPHRPMLEVELADAVIRICDLAGKLGYDLGGAIVEKTAFNDNRTDHRMEARQAAGGKAY